MSIRPRNPRWILANCRGSHFVEFSTASAIITLGVVLSANVVQGQIVELANIGRCTYATLEIPDPRPSEGLFVCQSSSQPRDERIISIVEDLHILPSSLADTNSRPPYNGD